jgi:3-hydroxyacyl-CoA dehydrogenase/enoyl-CoA hydratase/3-hydroxybutyryl-CoA epimerase
MGPHDQAALLGRITPTARAADLQGSDLIIEAVFEKPRAQGHGDAGGRAHAGAGRLLSPATPPPCPSAAWPAASAVPSKFIGIHFFSPVDKMKLVEIIRGQQTDDETVARAFDYVQALGKIPIVVNDSRGFYTSRTFGTFVMEGAAMLDEGIPAPVIENAAMPGRHAGGPAGGDRRNLAVAERARDGADPRRLRRRGQGLHRDGAGELLVERMVKEFKRTGRAAGGGFYDYPRRPEKAPVARAQDPLSRSPASPGYLQDVKDRILYRQAVETARCLGRGRADHGARRQHRLDLRHRLPGLGPAGALQFHLQPGAWTPSPRAPPSWPRSTEPASH